MMQHKEFNIPFSGLKQGRHEFSYSIDNAFFESFGYDEFNGADLNVNVTLEKRSTVLELDFRAAGTVNVNCDLTNEPFDLPLETQMELVVKFGDEYNDEDDDILILPHGEHQVNIGQYVYEMLVLAVPAKRVHPGVVDGSLKSELLDRLENMQPKEEKDNNKETDPRWDALKNFLTDK